MHGSDHGRSLARLLLAHLDALDTQLTSTSPPHAGARQHEPDSPALQDTLLEEPTPALVPDESAVLATAERFPWAVAAPEVRHWPDGSFLDVALSAVRPEEREGYIERLVAFVEQHRARLENLLRAYGPASTPASHGRYALIGQPETLVILERMEAAPFLLRGKWEEKY
ncbi:hypothetical protein [Streptomyces griseus]|uniref:hypothetical protein n=1 Tax=Streptomyces griseus TaxID=1911 RepID=UPI003795F667